MYPACFTFAPLLLDINLFRIISEAEAVEAEARSSEAESIGKAAAFASLTALHNIFVIS